MSRIKLILSLMFVMNIIASGQNTNPFFETWKTPFGVPPFDKIGNDHYKPAFLKAMEEQNREIEAIVTSKEVPDFKNTILAYDQSGSLLEKVSGVFSGLNSANTNKEMQEIARTLSPIQTEHADNIMLNPVLFSRISAVYEKREQLGLDAEQIRLTEEMYKGFVRGGAKLEPEAQLRLRDLNKAINLAQITFGQNLLAETNAYKLVVDNKDELEGMPEPILSAALEAGKSDSATRGKWVFTLQNPSVMPFLQFSANRKLREQIHQAYINRGNNNNANDNKELIKKLVELRREKARLFGYDNFASYVLENRMAKNPEQVYNLLNQIWTPALHKSLEELHPMEKLFLTEIGNDEFQPWDWRYYNERIQSDKFQMDEEMLKPYFKLENVLSGVFYVSNKLYGITFREVKNAPVYYPGVKLYECNDLDGSHLGVLYFDFHPRASKRGGAWCGTYRSQSYLDGKRVAPVVTIVCNFTAPAGDQPALLTADETQTLFHEFGHALHNLFKDVKYRGLSTVPRDFVELPSQIMEHWVFEPLVLKEYARHYKTGEIIPQEMIEKVNQIEKFGQGFKTTEYLAASFLDMDYHTIIEPREIDVIEFEENSMKNIGLISQILPRYRSTYFQHTMTGGYTAGYYSYIWSEVLDSDAFEAFTETGDIFNQEVARKFRKMILERGGSKEAMQMYIDFRRREPGIEPLLNNRGLN